VWHHNSDRKLGKQSLNGAACWFSQPENIFAEILRQDKKAECYLQLPSFFLVCSLRVLNGAGRSRLKTVVFEPALLQSLKRNRTMLRILKLFHKQEYLNFTRLTHWWLMSSSDHTNDISSGVREASRARPALLENVRGINCDLICCLSMSKSQHLLSAVDKLLGSNLAGLPVRSTASEMKSSSTQCPPPQFRSIRITAVTLLPCSSRALLVPDILLDIFVHVNCQEHTRNSWSRKSLAALARTCKTFHELTMDCFGLAWHRIEPLLGCVTRLHPMIYGDARVSVDSLRNVHFTHNLV
jgi:hypothetical protein